MKKVSGVSGSNWLGAYVVMALVMVALLVMCTTGTVVRITNNFLAVIVVLLLLFGVVGCLYKVASLWKQLHGTPAATATSTPVATAAPTPAATATPTPVATAAPTPAARKLTRRYLDAWRAEVEDALVEANEILTQAEQEEDEYKAKRLEYEAALRKARARRQP